jgi:hypothetical protein
MTNSIIEIAQKLVIKDLDLEVPGIVFSTNEKLTTWLTEIISVMIDRDFQRLLNVLYRIDVDELKTKAAFADDDPARRLAELIINRELQKVESRKKYKS